MFRWIVTRTSLFYHLLNLMEKTEVHESVRLVVLSLCLHNRVQDPRKTSIKQLRALHRETSHTFPNSRIVFSLIHYSPALPQEEKDNLDVINSHIRKNFPFLSLLPGFSTESDYIHWTRKSAESILYMWLNELDIDF